MGNTKSRKMEKKEGERARPGTKSTAIKAGQFCITFIANIMKKEMSSSFSKTLLNFYKGTKTHDGVIVSSLNCLIYLHLSLLRRYRYNEGKN